MSNFLASSFLPENVLPTPKHLKYLSVKESLEEQNRLRDAKIENFRGQLIEDWMDYLTNPNKQPLRTDLFKINSSDKNYYRKHPSVVYILKSISKDEPGGLRYMPKIFIPTGGFFNKKDAITKGFDCYISCNGELFIASTTYPLEDKGIISKKYGGKVELTNDELAYKISTERFLNLLL